MTIPKDDLPKSVEKKLREETAVDKPASQTLPNDSTVPELSSEQKVVAADLGVDLSGKTPSGQRFFKDTTEEASSPDPEEIRVKRSN